jgi:ubiquinone biosynthesis UbiH/UbiF/VisC/COQ6 family hydroxylase
MDKPMQNNFDVIIIGAGPAGLCMAKALSKLDLKILIVEKNSEESIASPAFDGRDIALTHFSKGVLGDMGIWERFSEKEISFINEAKVFNGNSLYFLNFLGDKLKNLAFIVSNNLIRKASYEAVKDDKNITLLTSALISNFKLTDEMVEAKLSSGEKVTSKLLVAADSRFSETRKKVGISASMKDFGKTMLVCQMSHNLPHEGVANECFLYGNTLAVLPLHGNRSSVILTSTPQEINSVYEMPEPEFNAYIKNLFVNRYGDMSLDSDRYCYPLVAVYSHAFTSKRFALIGDAAVGMHPVTAHGFNLGLRAQNTLVNRIEKAMKSGRDIGSEEVLDYYQNQHKKVTRPLYLATNKIVDLYTKDSMAARVARDAFIHISNNVLPIKSFITSKLLEDETSESRGFLPVFRDAIKDPN